jgi:hypothetical protein
LWIFVNRVLSSLFSGISEILLGVAEVVVKVLEAVANILEAAGKVLETVGKVLETVANVFLACEVFIQTPDGDRGDSHNPQEDSSQVTTPPSYSVSFYIHLGLSDPLFENANLFTAPGGSC